MTTPEDKLRAEILADAGKKAERVRNRARKDAMALLEAARAKYAQERQAQLDEANKEAQDKARAILATIEYEIRRQWLNSQEELVNSILSQALDQAETSPAPVLAASLQQLLLEAASAFPATAVQVRVRPEHRELLDCASIHAQLKAAQPQLGELTFQEAAELSAGVIVSSTDQRLCFDNTYRARLQRLRQGLRVAIGQALGATTDVRIFLAEPEAPGNGS